jgi:hypothetical protein
MLSSRIHELFLAHDGLKQVDVLSTLLFNLTRESRTPSHLITFKIKFNITPSTQSWDSLVSIATDCGLDDRMIRVRIPAGAENFSLRHRVSTGSVAHPTSYPMGTRGYFPGVKRLAREPDHSPPSSTEVKERVKLYLHFPNTCSRQLYLLPHIYA